MDTVKIKDIKPAEYNPRKLSDDAFKTLQESIDKLGFILPIILNKDNNTIVAGHQRTKSCLALGIDEVPYYSISGVDLRDEILFNQIHNGVEYEPETFARCSHDQKEGFTQLHNKLFTIRDYNAVVVKEMCRMLIKYGNVLCAIVCNGEVLFGNNYVYACKTVNMPVNCSFIPTEKLADFKYYFSRKYGVFNYEKIERSDFVQGLAQPNRAGGIEWGPLYRRVIPILKTLPKEAHILDFGCGKGYFINKVHKVLGFKNAVGLEFFHHNRKGISIEHGQKNIDQFIESVKRHGKFDVVICDAVINSVNTQEAEDAVMGCLNVFLKEGGKVFFSGRRREFIDQKLNREKATTEEREVYFPDENGLTAVMREGKWFFQKFLYAEKVKEITQENNFLPFNEYTNAGYFGVCATKITDIPKEKAIKSLEYEFNLKLPGGKRYNRHEEVIKLFNY